MASPVLTTTPPLADGLRALGLRRTAEDLADLVARATRGRWSPATFLEELVRAEAQDRAQRSLERRLTRARLGRFKPMADFDWNWPKALDRDAVERVLALGFLASGSNVILAAAQGLGKTMIAKNVAHQAVLQGHSVLCVTAADLVLDLGGQETARALERRLRQTGGWTGLSVALLFGHFIIPFVGLISRHAKRRVAILAFWCVWMLIFHWVDLYYLVMPHLMLRQVGWNVPLAMDTTFQPLDLACLIGLGGLYVAALVHRARACNLLPVKDPRLEESLAFENY